MRTNGLGRSILALAFSGLVANVGPAAADGAALAKSLAGDLGISEDQAIGGTKALLEVAKSNLGEDEFAELLSGSAGLEDIGKGKLAGKAVKQMASGHEGHMVGEGTAGEGGLTSLAQNADLVKQFGDLGMDSDMIGRFAGKLLDLVGGEGPGSGLLSPKTKLLRKGLGLL
jgi:hypothetical protein